MAGFIVILHCLSDYFPTGLKKERMPRRRRTRVPTGMRISTADRIWLAVTIYVVAPNNVAGSVGS